jgi:hypothetical protein
MAKASIESIFCFSLIFRIWQHVQIKCLSPRKKDFLLFPVHKAPSLPHFPSLFSRLAHLVLSSVILDFLLDWDRSGGGGGCSGIPLARPVFLAHPNFGYIYKLSVAYLSAALCSTKYFSLNCCICICTPLYSSPFLTFRSFLPGSSRLESTRLFSGWQILLSFCRIV